jgi:S-adenosyl-L-methionine hydrolase (adenosine-forming)
MSVVTLLTDFGTRDYFVGAMKGVILSVNPNAQIIDITHEIEPQQIKSAAFTLAACYKNFPPGTIHLAVVDPGVGSTRRAISVAAEDYFFVAPDNGLLSFIFNEKKDFRVFELTERKYFLPEISQTFHGRDIFAPVAAHLSKGVKANEIGREINDFVRLEIPRPRETGGRIEAEVIHIDRFGNLVTNLRSDDLPNRFVIKIKNRKIKRRVRFYAEAEPGEIFTIAGSSGFLEISVFSRSAQKILGAEIGAPVIVEFESKVL